MTYTEQELINELHRVSEEHCDGKTPTKREMKQYGRISESTYYRKFGSWNKALKQCGLKVNEVYSKTDREYSKDELESEIERISEEIRNGGTPRYMDIVEYSDIQQRVFLNKFGSWNKVLKSCGFSLNREFRTKEKIKDKIQELHCELGRSPTVSEFDEKYNISTETIQHNFNSWNDVLEECGLELNQHNPTKNEIIDEIKKVSKQLDEKPTSQNFTKLSKYSLYSTRKLFGSWNDAVKEAGFEPQPQQARGENHAQWRGGVSDVDYGFSWNQQRKRAIQRDNHSCRVCGNSEHIIDVHHITPVRFWEVETEHTKMNSLNNLISLCRSCHGKLEGEFKGRGHKLFEQLAKNNLNMH